MIRKTEPFHVQIGVAEAFEMRCEGGDGIIPVHHAAHDFAVAATDEIVVLDQRYPGQSASTLFLKMKLELLGMEAMIHPPGMMTRAISFT